MLLRCIYAATCETQGSGDIHGRDFLPLTAMIVGSSRTRSQRQRPKSYKLGGVSCAARIGSKTLTDRTIVDPPTLKILVSDFGLVGERFPPELEAIVTQYEFQQMFAAAKKSHDRARLCDLLQCVTTGREAAIERTFEPWEKRGIVVWIDHSSHSSAMLTGGCTCRAPRKQLKVILQIPRGLTVAWRTNVAACRRVLAFATVLLHNDSATLATTSSLELLPTDLLEKIVGCMPSPDDDAHDHVPRVGQKLSC